MKRILVFGSNLRGIHGAGSALHAKQNYGAEIGVGVGRTGNSYAIPTKDRYLRVLSLRSIQKDVDEFIWYAKSHPELEFEVVKIGCGLAGYTEKQIAPMFRSAPPNCLLPDRWRQM